MASVAKPNADAMLRQGLRYLAASVQDGHPLFGLIHANYAKILFEELIRSGAEPEVRSYLKAANLAQDKWSKTILTKLPLSELPTVRHMVSNVTPADIAAFKKTGLL